MERNQIKWEPTDLWCHTMTEVHDGNVVGVRPLVQTQVVSQTVLQLEKQETDNNRWKRGEGESENEKGISSDDKTRRMWVLSFE